MAKVTFKQRSSTGVSKGIKVIHSPKGTKLHKKLKLFKILLILSSIINVILVIKLIY